MGVGAERLIDALNLVESFGADTSRAGLRLRIEEFVAEHGDVQAVGAVLTLAVMLLGHVDPDIRAAVLYEMRDGFSDEFDFVDVSDEVEGSASGAAHDGSMDPPPRR
jgi:hypothetical protein